MSNLDDMRTLAEAHDLVFHHDYSGRGMYGRSCIGVAGSWDNFWSFALMVGSELDETLTIAMETAPNKDDYGHDTIWYWPQLSIDNIDA